MDMGVFLMRKQQVSVKVKKIGFSPKVAGIISGLLGLLVFSSNVASLFLLTGIIGMQNEIITSLICIAGSLSLIVGAALLIRRNMKGRIVLLIGIILFGISAVVGLFYSPLTALVNASFAAFTFFISLFVHN